MRTRVIIIVAAFVMAAAFSSAQIDPSKWVGGSKDSKDSKDIAAGLKEALKIGAGNAV